MNQGRIWIVKEMVKLIRRVEEEETFRVLLLIYLMEITEIIDLITNKKAEIIIITIKMEIV